VSQGSEDLQARLSALCARFSRLALQLADAGHDLRERATLPPESLPVEIGAALTAFDELRARVAVVAGGVDSLVGLPDLEAAIKTLVEKEERRARQQAEEARRKAEEAARRRAEEEARRKAEEETRRKAAEEARRKVEEEARRQAEQEARRQAEEEARRRAEDEARRRVVEAPHRAAEGQGQGTMATGPGTPTKATEEAGARWWVSAAGAWKEQCARGVAFADVLRQEIGRFPYLFSVPIQESAQYGGGQLAAAYAVVLHHVERRSPGFVNLAQERAGAGDGLGLRLYQQLAGEGRLTETYADLVREVVVAAVPSPGVWIDAGLSETEAATARFERSSSKIGSPELRPLRVPDEQRFGAHRFTFTVAPFTARFVRVNASELREPRSVEIMLKVGEAASDHAWILTVGAGAASGSQGPLLRHSRAGTSVTGLGQEWSAVWIAVFNADADTSQASELTVTLRRGPVAKPSAFARAAPKLR
jgi:hypothetical protein